MVSKSFSNADIDKSIVITYFKCNTMPFRFFHMVFHTHKIEHLKSSYSEGPDGILEVNHERYAELIASGL